MNSMKRGRGAEVHSQTQKGGSLFLFLFPFGRKKTYVGGLVQLLVAL